MGKGLRAASIAIVSLVLLPLVSSVLQEMINATPFVAGANNALTQILGWVASVAGANWYWLVLCMVTGIAIGTCADWMARKFDNSKQKTLIELAGELESLRQRFQEVYDDRSLDMRKATLAATDFHALKVSLRKLRISAPEYTWLPTHGEGERYLKENMAYCAVVGAIMRKGHLKEARIAASAVTRQSSPPPAGASSQLMPPV